MPALAPDFKALVNDIRSQDATGWRALAKRCTDYYDHKQISQEMLNELERLGMPDIIENLIHAPINSVLGQEAQKRRDWMVQADDDESQEVAEALNQKLNEQLRLTEANSRCSEAYASQIKAGLGWLHVRRNDDPFGSQYKIEFVHRDEIYWDMRDRTYDLSNCRWLARRHFKDVDEAKALMPEEYHIYIDMVASRWTALDQFNFAGTGYISQSAYNEWISNTANIEYMLDSQRKRVALYEVYYRAFEDMLVLSWDDGKREQFDDNNEMHLVALMSGQCSIEKRIVRRMRQKWFVGPHEVLDRVSPYPHEFFPYVPFFGYREDDTGVPYGLVRGMLDPQDAYNNCNIRMHHILNTKRVIKSEDATDMTDSEIVDEVNRRDGVITLRNGKSYNADLLIEQDWRELDRLMSMKVAHEQKIRDASGIYQAFSGKETNGQSGIAIASLAELGAVTLAEINDNYEYARKKLAELVLAYIVADMGNKQVMVRIKSDHGQNRKTVVLNHAQGSQVNNAVTLASYQVVLAPIQTSSGYRQHQHMRLMEMYTASPDPIKIALLPMVIESSEMPRRTEFLKKWNESQGINDDPEAQAAKSQAQAEQQQAEMQKMQALAQADLALKQAQAMQYKAQAELDQAKAAETLAGIDKLRNDEIIQERAAKVAMLTQARRQIATRKLAKL